ncbi:MAG: hypothetical protein WC574_07085 [Candidatus Omnitrophota bacterium]
MLREMYSLAWEDLRRKIPGYQKLNYLRNYRSGLSFKRHEEIKTFITAHLESDYRALQNTLVLLSYFWMVIIALRRLEKTGVTGFQGYLKKKEETVKRVIARHLGLSAETLAAYLANDAEVTKMVAGRLKDSPLTPDKLKAIFIEEASRRHKRGEYNFIAYFSRSSEAGQDRVILAVRRFYASERFLNRCNLRLAVILPEASVPDRDSVSAALRFGQAPIWDDLDLAALEHIQIIQGTLRRLLTLSLRELRGSLDNMAAALSRYSYAQYQDLSKEFDLPDIRLIFSSQANINQDRLERLEKLIAKTKKLAATTANPYLLNHPAAEANYWLAFLRKVLTALRYLKTKGPQVLDRYLKDKIKEKQNKSSQALVKAMSGQAQASLAWLVQHEASHIKIERIIKLLELIEQHKPVPFVVVVELFDTAVVLENSLKKEHGAKNVFHLDTKARRIAVEGFNHGDFDIIFISGGSKEEVVEYLKDKEFVILEERPNAWAVSLHKPSARTKPAVLEAVSQAEQLPLFDFDLLTVLPLAQQENCLDRYLRRRGKAYLADKLIRELGRQDIRIFPGSNIPAYRIAGVNTILNKEAEGIFLEEAVTKVKIGGKIHRIYHIGDKGVIALAGITGDAYAWVAGNEYKISQFYLRKYSRRDFLKLLAAWIFMCLAAIVQLGSFGYFPASAAAQDIEQKSRIIRNIKIKYGIYVDDGFSLPDLIKISDNLDIVQEHCPDLLKGLKRIIHNPEYTDGARGQYREDIIFGDRITLGDNFWVSRFFHELAHCIDDNLYGFRQFEELYKRSDKSRDIDFAYDYGKKHRKEDFATAVELFTISTPTQFRRAVYNFKKYGRAIYLEKIIEVVDVFTKGHPDYTVFFHDVYGEVFVRMKYICHVQIGRDVSGRILSIGGVVIYNPDGSYNLSNLELLVNNIFSLFEEARKLTESGMPNNPYPLTVPEKAREDIVNKFGRDVVLTNIAVTGFDLNRPEVFKGDHYERLMRLLKLLEQLLGRSPPFGWRLVITVNLISTEGNVASCDIDNRIIYIHPYFFELPQIKQLEILYHELISHIEKGIRCEDLAMGDTETFKKLFLGPQNSWSEGIQDSLPSFTPDIIDNIDKITNRRYVGPGVDLIESDLSKGLHTTGLATCAALIILDRNSNKHYFAHVLNEEYDGVRGRLKALLRLNIHDCEIYIMEGNKMPWSGRTVKTLVDLLTGAGAYGNIKLIDAPGGIAWAIISFEGKIYIYRDIYYKDIVPARMIVYNGDTERRQYSYPLPVPLELIDLKIPITAEDILSQLAERLVNIIVRAPPAGIRFVFTNDLALTNGMVAACDIDNRIVYIHPYFFNLSQSIQIEILFHELISHIEKGIRDENMAISDTRISFSQALRTQRLDILREAVDEAGKILKPEYGMPNTDLAVFIIGSCGIRQDTYPDDDIDALFVYREDGITAAGKPRREYYARLMGQTQRIMHVKGVSLDASGACFSFGSAEELYKYNTLFKYLVDGTGVNYHQLAILEADLLDRKPWAVELLDRIKGAMCQDYRILIPNIIQKDGIYSLRAGHLGLIFQRMSNIVFIMQLLYQLEFCSALEIFSEAVKRGLLSRREKDALSKAYLFFCRVAWEMHSLEIYYDSKLLPTDPVKVDELANYMNFSCGEEFKAEFYEQANIADEVCEVFYQRVARLNDFRGPASISGVEIKDIIARGLTTSLFPVDLILEHMPQVKKDTLEVDISYGTVFNEQGFYFGWQFDSRVAEGFIGFILHNGQNKLAEVSLCPDKQFGRRIIFRLWLAQELRRKGIGSAWLVQVLMPYFSSVGIKEIFTFWRCRDTEGYESFIRAMGFSTQVTFINDRDEGADILAVRDISPANEGVSHNITAASQFEAASLFCQQKHVAKKFIWLGNILLEVAEYLAASGKYLGPPVSKAEELPIAVNDLRNIFKYINGGEKELIRILKEEISGDLLTEEEIKEVLILIRIHEFYRNHDQGVIAQAEIIDIMFNCQKIYGNRKFANGAGYYGYALSVLLDFELIMEECSNNLQDINAKLSESELLLIRQARYAALLCLAENIDKAFFSHPALFLTDYDEGIVAGLVSSMWRVRQEPYFPPAESNARSIVLNQMNKLILVSCSGHNAEESPENPLSPLGMLLAFASLEASVDILTTPLNIIGQKRDVLVSQLCREIEEVYGILAVRLRLPILASRLKDKSYYLKYQDRYRQALNEIQHYLKLDDYFEDGLRIVDGLTAEITDEFTRRGIEFEIVTSRLKDIAAVIKKIVYRWGVGKVRSLLFGEHELSDINDYFTFRVVLKRMEDAAAAKDVIDKIFKAQGGNQVGNAELKSRFSGHPYDAVHLLYQDALRRPYEFIILPTIFDHRAERVGTGAHWIFIAQKYDFLKNQLFVPDKVELVGNIFSDFALLYHSLEEYAYPSVLLYNPSKRVSVGSLLPVRVRLNAMAADTMALAEVDMLKEDYSGRVRFYTLKSHFPQEIVPSPVLDFLNFEIDFDQNKDGHYRRVVTSDILMFEQGHKITPGSQKDKLIRAGYQMPRTLLKLHLAQNPRQAAALSLRGKFIFEIMVLIVAGVVKEFEVRQVLAKHQIAGKLLISLANAQDAVINEIREAVRCGDRKCNLPLHDFNAQILPFLLELSGLRNAEELYQWIALISADKNCELMLNEKASFMNLFLNETVRQLFCRDWLAVVLDIDDTIKPKGKIVMPLDIWEALNVLIMSFPLFSITARAPLNPDGFAPYEFWLQYMEPSLREDIYIITSKSVNLVGLDRVGIKLYSNEFPEEFKKLITAMALRRLSNFPGIRIVQNERGVTLAVPIEQEGSLQEIERQLNEGIAEIASQIKDLPAVQVGPAFIDRIFRECLLDVQPAGMRKSLALRWVAEIMQLQYGCSHLSLDEIIERLVILDDSDKDLISVGFNVGKDPGLGGNFIGYFERGSLLVLMLIGLRGKYSDSSINNFGGVEMPDPDESMQPSHLINILETRFFDNRPSWPLRIILSAFVVPHEFGNLLQSKLTGMPVSVNLSLKDLFAGIHYQSRAPPCWGGILVNFVIFFFGVFLLSSQAIPFVSASISIIGIGNLIHGLIDLYFNIRKIESSNYSRIIISGFRNFWANIFYLWLIVIIISTIGFTNFSLIRTNQPAGVSVLQEHSSVVGDKEETGP